MTDREKVAELVQTYGFTDKESGICTDDVIAIVAWEMAQWKDEQYAKEIAELKQQFGKGLNDLCNGN